MPLIAGKSLISANFFSKGSPRARASSFDLTIGSIIDDQGHEIVGPFALKAGEMVQVISAEVFSLSAETTGHVTYKTDLTKQGIWALTVGIVDPGWTGPIATTLLNFSKVDYVIAVGTPFLRVSFFEHEKVDTSLLPKQVDLHAYLLDIQDKAMSRFPKTFLNQERIGADAGDRVLKRIRDEALVWIAVVAILFTVIQLGSVAYERGSIFPPANEIDSLNAKTESLNSRIARIEQEQRRSAEMQRNKKTFAPDAHTPK